MPPASTTTTVAFIFKNFYSEKEIGDMTKRGRPAWKMCPRSEGVIGGNGHYYSMIGGNPQGVGGTMAGAQGNVSSSKGKQLVAAAKVKYGYITLDGVSILKSKGDKAALMSLVTREADGIIEEVADCAAFDFYRDGTCTRGRRASINSNTVTLTVADDARYFKEGMTVGASPNANLSSPRSGTTTVSAVDEDGGTVTLTNAGSIGSFSDNDYIFRYTEDNTGVEGLASLLPLTAPSSGETFRGIDRSSNPRRYAGVRINDTGTAIEENVGLAAIKVDQVGQEATVCMLNPINFWTVAKRAQSKVTYDGGGVKASYGFQGVDIYTPAGVVRCVSDPFCPTNRFYLLNWDWIYYAHLEGAPHVIMDDTLKWLRMTADDGLESRVRLVSNLVITRPGSCAVGAI